MCLIAVITCRLVLPLCVCVCTETGVVYVCGDVHDCVCVCVWCTETGVVYVCSDVHDVAWSHLNAHWLGQSTADAETVEYRLCCWWCSCWHSKQWWGLPANSTENSWHCPTHWTWPSLIGQLDGEHRYVNSLALWSTSSSHGNIAIWSNHWWL